jgi:hypothetical protein
MNITNQEKLILYAFHKRLDRDIFFIVVSSSPFQGILIIIYRRTDDWKLSSDCIFRKKYNSQQEVFDEVEEVCIRILFGVEGNR